MKKNYLLIICVLLIFSLIGCAQKQDAQQPLIEREALIIAMKGGISGFHPWIKTYENPTSIVNRAIYSNLVELDANLKIVPALAISWINLGDNVWRFRLREDIVFQNGYKFSARDVKFSLELIKNDEQSVYQEFVSGIERIKIVDDYIIDIITAKPSPVMLRKLSEINILSEKYHQETQSKLPIGTGPYKLINYVPGDYIELERFNGYWRGSLPAKKLIFKIIPDDQERIEQLLDGKIDIATSIPPVKMRILEESKNAQVFTVPTVRVIFLSYDMREYGSNGFPNQKNPISDLRVRKAMYHSIKENEIIDQVMGGLAEPATQIITHNIFGYNPKIKRLKYDLAKARKLMQDAGYADGFEIEFDCPNDRYVNDQAICERIVEYLSKINIKVKLNAQTKSKFFPKVIRKESAFYLIGWAAATLDGGEIFDYHFRTYDPEGGVGVYNHAFYSNPEVDRLGQESAQTIDPEERLKMMQQGFKIAANDLVIIPLHIQMLIYGVSNDIEWQPRPDEQIGVDEIRFRN